MAIAYVQSTSVSQAATSSGSLTFPAANTKNGLILVGIRLPTSTATITSISDTNVNTYTNVFKVQSTDSHQAACYYAEGISSGTNTVSVFLSSASAFQWDILEYSGLLSTKSLDKFASTTGNTVSPTSPTVTNSGANELLFGVASATAGVTWVAGTGYTIREALTRESVEDQVVSASGSFNAVTSMSGATGWTMSIVTFNSTVAPAAGGSVVSPRLLTLMGVGS